MPKDKSGGGGGGGKGGAPAAEPPIGAITGTDAADIVSLSGPIASTNGDDVIWTLAGDDTIEAGDGNDTIEAGDGNDTINDGAGDDTVNAGAGDDTYYGSAGSDTVDGGDGYDVAIYYTSDGDWSVTPITEIQGKGKNAREVVTGYTVTDASTGEVDTLSNWEQVLILDLPPPTGTIITQGDGESTVFDSAVTVDVLSNDYLEGGDFGVGLSITAIIDFQIDLDNDGVNDVDLIPDGADLSYYFGGGLLNDGSILTLNPDDTLTWDPNGQYDAAPTSGDPAPSIQFWYEVTDGAGAFEYGDVTIQILHPVAPAEVVTFESLQLIGDDFSRDALGLWEYLDQPDGVFKLSQASNALDGVYFYPYEERDPGATDFDYDGDGDAEFRVWTDSTGVTHEMVLSQSSGSSFDLGGMTITGLDVGETATIGLVRSDFTVATVDITLSDLDPGGVLEFTNATDVIQVVVEASVGDEFYIDDVFTI